nr:MAG: Transcriptional regulator, RHH-like, CopG [Bacteriophage sp.]UWG91763.1 MAG: Transcriptional regulator, RHH-like, CopG [Bacteriophage sp.]
MGRPKIDNPKTYDLKVRVDELTNKKIEAFAKKKKLTKAEVVRQGIYLILEQNK